MYRTMWTTDTTCVYLSLETLEILTARDEVKSRAVIREGIHSTGRTDPSQENKEI